MITGNGKTVISKLNFKLTLYLHSAGFYFLCEKKVEINTESIDEIF